jgi:ankyrin repeat protein
MQMLRKCLLVGLALGSLIFCSAPKYRPDAQQKLGDQLIAATKAGNKKEVAKLLTQGADVNYFDGVGTALLYALRNGHERDAIKKEHERIVGLLLGWPKINVNMCGLDDEGSDALSALMVAARDGRTEMVKSLLNVPGIDVNLGSSHYGKTALMFAAEEGNDDIVALLIKTNAEGIDVNAKDHATEFTALHYAVKGNKVSVVNLLGKVPGIKVNAQDFQMKRTPLMWAAVLGYKDVVIALLNIKGIDTKLKVVGGKTASDLAREAANKPGNSGKRKTFEEIAKLIDAGPVALHLLGVAPTVNVKNLGPYIVSKKSFYKELYPGKVYSTTEIMGYSSYDKDKKELYKNFKDQYGFDTWKKCSMTVGGKFLQQSKQPLPNTLGAVYSLESTDPMNKELFYVQYQDQPSQGMIICAKGIPSNTVSLLGIFSLPLRPLTSSGNLLALTPFKNPGNLFCRFNAYYDTDDKFFILQMPGGNSMLNFSYLCLKDGKVTVQPSLVHPLFLDKKDRSKFEVKFIAQ